MSTEIQKTWAQQDFGLDKRLLKALSKMGFVAPTAVQAQCIPVAMQGRDVLVRSRTGSGKTAAFALPLLHKLLLSKNADSSLAIQGVRAVILAPTKELCKQIERQVIEITYYCRDVVNVCSLADDNASAVAYRLQSRPDIIISTPAKLVQQLKNSAIDLSMVETLVVDEADLVLSFGYAEDVQMITSKMPKIFQGLLMSATLSPELEKFKRLVLHNPAMLKINETQATGHLLQFYLNAKETDKYLILYVFMKLGLLQGKGLIFVNDVNKCYRLKLFLQQFFIPAAVLNSEVPLNSRLHILDEFNRGVFDYLIATDSSLDSGEADEKDSDAEEGAEGAAGSDEEGEEEDESGDDDDDSESDDDVSIEISGDEDEDEDEEEDDEDDEQDDSSDSEEDKKGKSAKGKSSGKSDKAAVSASNAAAAVAKKSTGAVKTTEEGYGVSRGIDFQGVNFVINFDLPLTAAAYTHRIGRTARGGASGTALSFVSTAAPSSTTTEKEVAVKDQRVLREIQLAQPRHAAGESSSGTGGVLAAIGAVPVDDLALAASGAVPLDDESKYQPQPLIFNMKELDTFRYRVEETIRSVTNNAVREFRAAELKQELLNSAKLKSYFAENPDDLKVLRHDSSVAHPIRVKEHLKYVPSYLVPPSMRGPASTANQKRKKRKAGKGAMNSQDAKRHASKMRDPLQSLTVEGGGDDANADGADGGDADAAGAFTEAPKKVFTSTEQLGRSTSGRQNWKEKHRRGKFNPKRLKREKGEIAGAFTKSKGYK